MSTKVEYLEDLVQTMEAQLKEKDEHWSIKYNDMELKFADEKAMCNAYRAKAEKQTEYNDKIINENSMQEDNLLLEIQRLQQELRSEKMALLKQNLERDEFKKTFDLFREDFKSKENQLKVEKEENENRSTK